MAVEGVSAVCIREGSILFKKLSQNSSDVQEIKITAIHDISMQNTKTI